MAGSYSTDLRERVLAAVEAGATPEAAARRVAVGRSTAYRWATAARVEGRRAAKRTGGATPETRGTADAAGPRGALAEAAISRYKRVIGGALHSRTDGRQATGVAIAARALNRMPGLGRPESVRIA